jgi:Pyruvate/2-oxoacid:ferredoxin oxidoreductase delta subunit
VSKQEAMDVLKACKEVCLVHISQNVIEDTEFICNCDRWHRRAMKIGLDQPKPALFLNSGFQPRFDLDGSVSCGTCIDRCPPSALSVGDGDVLEVDLDRCFGCVACATSCSSEAIDMVAKPGFVSPPKDLRALGAAVRARLFQTSSSSFSKSGGEWV